MEKLNLGDEETTDAERNIFLFSILQSKIYLLVMKIK